ncbi:MAG TPA: excinuclease ABC subunit UvrA [Acidimicrobiales bacterium]|nr:excinuclease ABC subunit UvrA [Acidimicrobiales bacterium]
MSATGHEQIEVRGARENNLRGVDIDIPKRQLTVFTGVSGSGKSSLVFGTIASESQRLINETYSAFLQSFMPNLPRPEVDSLANLSAAIVVDQERMGTNSRSTVGTATDAYSMLRLVYSRSGQPHVGSSNMFSFNDPQGMCPACEGIGKVSTVDIDGLVDRDLSLNEGAITFPNFAVDSWYWKVFSESGFFDADKKLRDYTPEEWERFLHGPETKIKGDSFNWTYEGLVSKVRRLFLVKDVDSLQKHIRVQVERIATFAACGDCGGARLNAAALGSRIDGVNIAECAAMQVSDLADFVAKIDDPSVAPLLQTLRGTLDNLVEIGLGYLSLDRESGSLSGGEAQRVKMVRHLGSSLTDITYLFDEPTVGLHPHDVQRMNDLLRQLRDKGNTVLVVEHEPEVIVVADHVVDMGPGAGSAGGTVVYQGTVDGLRASGTRTGLHLEQQQVLKADDEVRRPTGTLRIEHAGLHNLQDVSVDIPLGVLVAVTGVAGSGKSSLIHGCLPRTDKVTFLDQAPIRGSRRSNPATYTGVLDPIRKAFAKENGVKAALFSANSEGACAVCGGIGLIYTDLAFMAGVASPCEECEGKRFTREVLQFELRGRDISEVLAMPVTEAAEFFTEKAVRPMLSSLASVGLGYVALGQPLTTLSGGERQRLKLAIQMHGASDVFVLDEPTSGLHMADVDNLIGLLDELVDGGRTVVVIEHNLDIVARADWVLDMGPGAGHDGGRVVFEGTPAALAASDRSLTGEHLRARY